MTEDFEVPSPHEKHVEHVSEHAHARSDSFASKIAVTTAIMATLGALLSYQAGSSESLAAMDKSAIAANVDRCHPQAETGHAAIEHCTESVLIKP